MRLSLESVPCDLCGSDRYEQVLSGQDALTDLPGTFRFVRCTNCGLIRQNPRLTPSALLQYYPESYPSFAQSVGSRASILRRIDYRVGQLRRVRLVRRLCRTGSLLDVGCGTGDFLYEMRKLKGWRLFGVEPNRYACGHAQRLVGKRVVCGTLSAAALADSSFDMVTMWNTLEHVQDPKTNLRQANRVLRPDGLLVISAPVSSSLLCRWFREHWAEWDLPRHLYIFSRNTIEAMLQETGFGLEAVYRSSTEYRVLCMTLESWTKEHSSSKSVQRATGLLLRLLPVRLLGKVALRVLIPSARESVLVFVCKKRS